MALPFNLERLARDVALLDRILVRDEGGGVEIVGPNVLVLEAVLELEPGVECVDRASAEINGLGSGQVLPLVHPDARMRHESLRTLLEVGGDGDEWNLRLGREEIPDHVAAHVKFELARQQQQRAVGLWAAWNDGDVESILGVSAVGRRLKEAARRRIGQPIGAELHLVERQRRPTEAEQSHQGSKHRQSHFDTPRPYGLLLSEGGEIKKVPAPNSFPSRGSPVCCELHCQAVLPVHVRSVYMAGANTS